MAITDCELPRSPRLSSGSTVSNRFFRSIHVSFPACSLTRQLTDGCSYGIANLFQSSLSAAAQPVAALVGAPRRYLAATAVVLFGRMFSRGRLSTTGAGKRWGTAPAAKPQPFAAGTGTAVARRY